MEDIPLYNSRITKSYVEYLNEHLPDVDVEPLLKYAGIEKYQLDDEGHWLTQKQVDRFHEILARTAQDPDIARKVGRFSVTSQASGALGKYILGFINPATAYAVLEKINSRLSRGTVLETRVIGKNKIEAKAFVRPGVIEKPYQCSNRLGGLEALAKLSTQKFATIEHPVCIHKGGDCCLYIISWEPSPTLVWKRARNYFLVLALAASAALFGFMETGPWIALFLSFMFGTMGLALYVEHLEKKNLLLNIKNQGEAAENLLNQINKRYNEALLVEEIGKTASMLHEVDVLPKRILDTLIKRLDFDRGIIMLVNKKENCLIYATSTGYNPKDDDYLRNIKFRLDNPHSKGSFVEAFKKQQPVLINDIEDIENDLSPRSRDFLHTMGSRSFICVPIIYQGESMGILAADNIQSKRPLSQIDMSLLMGIAPQIGIGISNAMWHQKIKESEERFRSLSENAPDIIYTLGIKGEFTYINPAIEPVLGYRPEELLGKYFIDIARKEDAVRTIRAFKRVRDLKQTIKEETAIIPHKDGTDRYVSISCAPNFDSDGQFVGVVGTFKNLTEIKKTETQLESNILKLQSAMSSTIDAISIIVESRDPYTAGHQRRVAQLATAIAEELDLPEEKIDQIRMASLIHDLGKIYIPSEILTKPGKLNQVEFAMMKSHPEVAWNILKRVDFIPAIVDMVYQHHERMDGSGYPQGISGNEILLEARIIAVADTVEAMASHRPYRAALGTDVALEEIQNKQGVTYDSRVVNACLKLFKERAFKFIDLEESSGMTA
ncbi:MAG: PAS domain S-box protein [Syntrophales bacterium]|jgi:PAS domain S-box-containing protein/putative nucleotidyltransferase with HDIG domain|nr:PAS domain S-box protein [Syntrophales bacterium]MCK9528633.1 PAS domain S-box protein [Syntrophales bacterium]MDX9923074.1 PAS domain S-box protein [Syntrophales bacterium]